MSQSERDQDGLRPEYAVFIPAGARVNPDFLWDTVESALHFMGQQTLVIIGDDSGIDKFKHLEGKAPRVFVRPMPTVGDPTRSYTVSGSLFLKKARVMRSVLAEFQFDRVVFLDDDALILNDRFLGATERLLERHPKAGVVGRYCLNHEYQPVLLIAQYEKITSQISRNPLKARKYVPLTKQAKLRSLFRPLVFEALANGYATGMSYVGGAAVFTRDCLEAITKRPELDSDILRLTPSWEDDLFTIFTHACGFKIYDVLEYPPVFQIAWGELTISPEELVKQEASVIHSVRDKRFGGEAPIREFFRKHRGPAAGA